MGNAKTLIEQVLKFGIVGFAAFVVDYGVLMLLSQFLGMNAVLASGISFVVSCTFNYLASMHYVFRHREGMSKRREFTIFVALSVVGLAINELVMWAGTAMAGESALAITVTKVIATAVVMVWNFLSRKRWLDADR